MSLRRISDIQQMPVLDLETGEILGQVLDWYVSPAQQRIVAYLINRPTLWKKAEVIVPADITEYAPKMIVVRDQDVLIDPTEVVGLASLMSVNMNLIGFRAETEAGKLLGGVVDFTIEVTGATIQQYEVKAPTLIGALQNNLLLPASRVLRVESHRLVFPDNVLATTEVVRQQQTQVT